VTYTHFEFEETSHQNALPTGTVLVAVKKAMAGTIRQMGATYAPLPQVA